MPFLFLLFVLVPVVEIALFIRVGGAIGLLPTLAVVLATAALGTWMLRREGLATLAKARARLDLGELPASQLLEGMLLLVGGTLLLTPGFMTDAVGFACLLPPTRRWLVARLASGALGRVGIGAASGTRPGMGSGLGARPDDPAARGTGTGPVGADARTRRGDVIDGDFERLD